VSTKSSSSQQKRAKKKRQKELKRRKKRQTQVLKNAGRSDWHDPPSIIDIPQPVRTLDGDPDLATVMRSGSGIESVLDSLDLFGKQDLSANIGESLEKPIERIVAEKWWAEYMDADGVGRLAMTRKKLALLPFDQQEDYFPDAIFEMETKLDADQYVGFLVEIELQQPGVFAENLEWFASSMIFYYLNRGESEQLEHVVSVMAEKQQNVSESFFRIFCCVAARRTRSIGVATSAFGRRLSTKFRADVLGR